MGRFNERCLAQRRAEGLGTQAPLKLLLKMYSATTRAVIARSCHYRRSRVGCILNGDTLFGVPRMFRFVADQNVSRFEDRLRSESDSAKRYLLRTLLIEEEDRFAA